MRVQETCHVQKSHEQLASLVDREFQCWNGRKILQIPSNAIGIGVYAVSARVLAAYYGAFWALGEAITLLPRMVTLGASVVAIDGFSSKCAQRIMKVYATSLGITALQGASFVAAMTLPEFFYGHLKAQKTFFLHHSEAFIQTLPDLPEVYRPVYKVFGVNLFDSLSAMWLDLGFTNYEYKNALKLEFCKRYQQKPESGSELLDPSSNIFRKSLFTVLSSQVVSTLNERAKQKAITEKDIDNLDCKTYAWMYTELSKEAREQIGALRPELEDGLEDVVQHAGALFELLTDYRYRAPQSVMLSELLLHNMKQARDSLLATKTFTEDDIAEMMEAPMCAINCQGIFRFANSIELSSDENPHVILNAVDGKELRIRDDIQFFAMRQPLIELHRAIKELTPSELVLLKRELSFKNERETNNEKIVKVYRMLVTLKYQIEKQVMATEKLRPQDQTSWIEAFTVEEV